MRLVTLTLALALLVVAGPASAGQPLYRTDRQAETYLEHGLKAWARIDLTKQAVKFASCFNGYYSKTEERTHRHFPQDRTNRAGAVAFRSFRLVRRDLNVVEANAPIEPRGSQGDFVVGIASPNPVLEFCPCRI